MNIKERALELKRIKNRLVELQPMYDEYFQLLENQRNRLKELSNIVGQHITDGRCSDRLLEMIVSLVDEPIPPAEPVQELRRHNLAPVPLTLDTSVPMVMVTKDSPEKGLFPAVDRVLANPFNIFKCGIFSENPAKVYRMAFIYENEDGEICRDVLEAEKLPQNVEWFSVPEWFADLLEAAT